MNRTTPELTLPESLLLLALHDQKGTVSIGGYAHIGLGGGLLAELLLGGWVAIEGDDKRAKLVVQPGAAPPADPLLTACLEQVRTAKRPRDPGQWVLTFGQRKGLTHQIAEGLCQRGILRAEQARVLLIFPRTVFPEVDPGPERRLLEMLEQAIFTDASIDDPHRLALIAIADAAGLLAPNLGRKRLKTRKDRLAQLRTQDASGQAAEAAKAAIEAAVAISAAMTAASAAVTISVTS
ncbi:MAG: GPP34 family phosphoprotein [Acidobacteriota bacterium]